jgi:hypothetical protein
VFIIKRKRKFCTNVFQKAYQKRILNLKIVEQRFEPMKRRKIPIFNAIKINEKRISYYQRIKKAFFDILKERETK